MPTVSFIAVRGTLRLYPRHVHRRCNRGRRAPNPWLLDQPHLLQRREPPEGLDLDLADALAGDPQVDADLAERPRIGLVQPVAKDDHVAMALRERAKRIRDG